MATAVTHALPVAAKARRTPLAYWHLLSLDAPSVAVLWTIFLAKAFDVHLRFDIPLSLGLAVWVLYAADRIQDAVRGGLLEERHRFHLLHRRPLSIAIVGVVVTILALLWNLPLALRTAWLLLSLPLLCYLLMIHVLHIPKMPKEAAVAFFFGAATALPCVIAEGVALRLMMPSILLFAGLCWCNGIAIARWEPHAHRTANVSTVWLARRFDLAGLVLACACLFQTGMRAYRPVALAVLLSIWLLRVVDQERGHLQPVTVRALADVALLTPLAIWPLLPLLWRR